MKILIFFFCNNIYEKLAFYLDDTIIYSGNIDNILIPSIMNIRIENNNV